MSFASRSILVSLLSAAGVAAQGTSVGGSITANTTWALSGSPYTLSKTVVVENGATLTIAAGVTVRMSAGEGITVGSSKLSKGTLIARGTVSKPIVFTSSETTKAAGDWNTVQFTDYSIDAAYSTGGAYTGGSILEHCVLEYGGDNSVYGAITVRLSSPAIRQCKVRDSKSCGIWADMTSTTTNVTPGLTVSGCELHRNGLQGIRVDSGAAHLITRCHAHHNKHTGISVSGAKDWKVSYNLVERNVFYGNGQLGGIFASGTNCKIENNTIRNNWMGGDGGGINLGSGVFYVDNNTIVSNTAYLGGGICVSQNQFLQNVWIRNNTIVGNHSRSNGGGIWKSRRSSSSGSSTVITGNTIANNSAAANGGGLYHRWGTHFYLNNNRFSSNSATMAGGGAWLGSGGSIYSVTGNRFAGNTSKTDGGGIWLGGKPTVFAGNTTTHNTFLGNIAKKGDAIFHAVTYQTNGGADLNAQSTCWGSTGPNSSANRIWDYTDDNTLGKVLASNPISCGPFANLGLGTSGTNGVPALTGTGTLKAAKPVTIKMTGARKNSSSAMFLDVSATFAYVPDFNGVVVPLNVPIIVPFTTDANGKVTLSVASFPSGIPAGLKFYLQFLVIDPAATGGLAFSNALLGIAQ